MILEAALYLSFAIVVVGIVKAYRRRQDVLYGPYIGQNDRKKQAPCPRSRPRSSLYVRKTLSAPTAGLPMAVAIIWVCSRTCVPTLRAADVQAACPVTGGTAWVPLHYLGGAAAPREAATP
jgi:hypothetical protein